MRLRDMTEEVMHNLQRNKIRTLLTMVGIVIGAFTILSVWSLGDGLQILLKEQTSVLSDPTTIECFPPGGINFSKIQKSFGTMGQLPRKVNEENVGLASLKIVYFAQKDMDLLQSIPHVEKISTFAIVPGEWIYLPGMEDKFEINMAPWRFDLEPKIIAGREIRDSGAYEIVLPYSYCKVFGVEAENLIGRTIEVKIGKHPVIRKYLEMNIIHNSLKRFKNLFDNNPQPPKDEYNKTFPVRVVGVIADNMFSSLGFISQNLLHESSRFFFHQPELFTKDNFGVIMRVKVDSPENVLKVKDAIEKAGMDTASMYDVVSSFSKILFIVEVFLSIFGAVALFIATLGIINTLLMSVHERKKEIGVLKALGATRSVIRNLFAMEASIIGFLGGITSIVIYFGVMLLGNHLAARFFPLLWKNTHLFHFDPMFIPQILLFTTFLGFIGGLYPAHKGASLEPIEALRYE